MDGIATRCERLADMHGGTDLALRVTHAMATQDEQRVALREAARRIRELEAELQAVRETGVE